MIVNVGTSDGASDADKVKFDNTESGLEATDVQGAIDEVSEAFQAGCDTIVSGITAFGVTPASNSPADIVTGINNVYAKGVSNTKVGTATVNQVLSGYTFTNKNGVGISGAMPNKTGTANHLGTATLGASNLFLSIPAQGFYNANNKLYATFATIANLIGLTASKIVKGNTILGIAGTGGGMKLLWSQAKAGDGTKYEANTISLSDLANYDGVVIKCCLANITGNNFVNEITGYQIEKGKSMRVGMINTGNENAMPYRHFEVTNNSVICSNGFTGAGGADGRYIYPFEIYGYTK